MLWIRKFGAAYIGLAFFYYHAIGGRNLNVFDDPCISYWRVGGKNDETKQDAEWKNKPEETGESNKKRNGDGTWHSSVWAASSYFFAGNVPVFAAGNVDTSQITNGFDAIYQVIAAIVSSIGLSSCYGDCSNGHSHWMHRTVAHSPLHLNESEVVW